MSEAAAPESDESTARSEASRASRPVTGSEPSLPERSRYAVLAFTIALGLLGWAVVLGLPLIGAISTVTTIPGSIAMFVAVIVVARALAFRSVEGGVLSLDSAYYVAAALCVGTLDAGRLVAVALSVDALLRLADARRRGRRDPDGTWAELGYVLYFGGMSGGLLVASAALWNADALVGSHSGDSAGQLLLRVIAIAGTLLIVHYAIQGVRQALLGKPLRAYLRDVALPSVAAESSLMPLGAVIVLLYDPDHPLGFILLSLTYLLINYVFARVSRIGEQLADRVHELELLNASGRRLSATLQLGELVEVIARETFRAVPDAEVVALVHRRPGEKRLVVDGFEPASETFTRQAAHEGEGAAGWVMAHGSSRRIDDLTVSDIATSARTSNIRSWLGAPLFMFGGCEGVIAVQSTRPAAFHDDQHRLIESLALQIAAALQNANLYELAMVDGLTGLFVRRYLDARIEEEIERSKRYGSAFSVVMLDVDDFKKLNDTYGHLVGDRVLRAIANVVKQQMRGVDTAARYGGEELCVILPRTEMVGGYNLAERIRAAIADLRITTDDDPPKVIGVTASLGIAAFPESKAADGTDLVRRADRALYRAKKLGKNRVELFWSDDSGPAFATMETPVPHE